MSDGCLSRSVSLLSSVFDCAQDDFNSFLWNVVMLAMGGSVLGEAVKSSGLLLTITRARPVCMRLLRDLLRHCVMWRSVLLCQTRQKASKSQHLAQQHS